MIKPNTNLLAWSPSPQDLAETLDGGQAFRWRRQPDNSWAGRWADQVVYLSLSLSGDLTWSSPSPNAETAQAVAKYFGN